MMLTLDSSATGKYRSEFQNVALCAKFSGPVKVSSNIVRGPQNDER